MAGAADQRPNDTSTPHRRRLKLVSFNIQTGISTSSYRDYVTGSWRYIWPTQKRLPNLNRIAQFLKPFDIVGLQEVDGGGARSNHIVQTHYLAEHAGFGYWHNQINRRLGTLALHSNGLLSRFRPQAVHDYKLPGPPGRGALLAQFGTPRRQALFLCVLHLALRQRIRLTQLGFLAELLRELPHVIVMGDFNCEPDSPEVKLLTQKTCLTDPAYNIKTFPSWRPQKMLDHILVTPSLKVCQVHAAHLSCSDHLPITMEVELPQEVSIVR
jgi:endonuclease/exonuclease/phosphatase family metal-dependent hydrolase